MKIAWQPSKVLKFGLYCNAACVRQSKPTLLLQIYKKKTTRCEYFVAKNHKARRGKTTIAKCWWLVFASEKLQNRKKSWRPYQIGEFLQQCGLSDLLTYAKGYHKLILPGIHICRHGKYPDARRRRNHKSFGNYPDHGCSRIPSRNKWRNRTLWPSEFAWNLHRPIRLKHRAKPVKISSRLLISKCLNYRIILGPFIGQVIFIRSEF